MKSTYFLILALLSSSLAQAQDEKGDKAVRATGGLSLISIAALKNADSKALAEKLSVRGFSHKVLFKNDVQKKMTSSEIATLKTLIKSDAHIVVIGTEKHAVGKAASLQNLITKIESRPGAYIESVKVLNDKVIVNASKRAAFIQYLSMGATFSTAIYAFVQRNSGSNEESSGRFISGGRTTTPKVEAPKLTPFKPLSSGANLQ